MAGGPAFGVGEKSPNLAKLLLVDTPAAERHREQRVEIANGGERETRLLQCSPRRRARAREQHAHPVDLRAGVAQRLREGEDAAGGRDQVLDQVDALTGDIAALDAPCCAMRLGFGADVDHRQRHPVGDESGEGDAGRDATGNDRGARLRHGLRKRCSRLCAGFGPREDQPAVHVERRTEPRGEAERRFGPHQEGAGIEQDRRNLLRRSAHPRPLPCRSPVVPRLARG